MSTPGHPHASRALVYWHRNQIAITFHSHENLYDTAIEKSGVNEKNVKRVMNSLRLDALTGYLQEKNVRITSLKKEDVPSLRTLDAAHEDTDEYGLIGAYPFPAADGDGTDVICLCHVTREKDHAVVAGIPEDITREVVELINNNRGDIQKHLESNQQKGAVNGAQGGRIQAAMPNWYGGATINGGGITHGCPMSPPIPIVPGDCCTFPESWNYHLQGLSGDILHADGSGTKIFVLDTAPDETTVRGAAARVGNANALLQEVIAKMDEGRFVINAPQMPPTLDEVLTGKDICGKLVGFHMDDHGLFVAGIVQNLAPQADIELIRVLNQFGTGDLSTLLSALVDIQSRMSNGLIDGKRVVINLSLVMTPADEELDELWYPDGRHPFATMRKRFELMRSVIHLAIKSLTAQGAIFVASSGNDSDPRSSHHLTTKHQMSERLGPRYPAAYPEVIAVGAVDRDGQAVPYSNSPQGSGGQHGIVTYGGRAPSTNCALTDVHDRIIPVVIDDAPRGIYSSAVVPALLSHDTNKELPDEPIPTESDAWVYWTGTSFATPIISALAARVLQTMKDRGVSMHPPRLASKVRRAITTALGQAEYLGAVLPLQHEFGSNVRMLRVVQSCSVVGHVGHGIEGVAAMEKEVAVGD